MTRPEVGLFDTSTLILLSRLEDPWVLPERLAISLAELAVGPLVTDDPAGRAARLIHGSLPPMRDDRN